MNNLREQVRNEMEGFEISRKNAITKLIEESKLTVESANREKLQLSKELKNGGSLGLEQEIEGLEEVMKENIDKIGKLNKMMDENIRIQALHNFLNDSEEIISIKETNEVTFEVETDNFEGEYLVLTENEAFEEVKDIIEEGVCYFSPSFLSAVTKFDTVVFEALCEIRENANNAIWSLIESKITKDKFVENVILEDGRGNYLASYDGEENEADIDGITYYIYRNN